MVVKFNHFQPKTVLVFILDYTSVHRINVTPILDAWSFLTPSNCAKLSFQIKPFTFYVETVNKSKLHMDHSFRMVWPHMVPTVICKSARVLAKVYINAVHIRDYYGARCDVLLANLKNAFTGFIFYKVHYCNFGISTMKTEDPSYLGEGIHNIKFCQSNIGLIHFNNGW